MDEDYGERSSLLDPYALRATITRYITTGHPITDWLVLSLLFSFISALTGLFSLQQCRHFWDWCWGHWRWQVPEAYQVTIETVRGRTSNAQTCVESSLDRLHAENQDLLEAFYWYLNRQQSLIKQADLGIKLGADTAHEDINLRHYFFMTRPTHEVTTPDGFMINIHSFTQRQKSQRHHRGNNRDDDDGDNNQKSRECLNQVLTIRNHQSLSAIHDFIDRVWKEYLDAVYPLIHRKHTDERWFFFRAEKGVYRRYGLETKVNFSGVFFAGKERLLRQIDAFRQGESPCPRFTILLASKPGCGKTSFVKALVNYSKCHVIVVKLSQINNISELMDLFYNPRLHVVNDHNDKNQTKIEIPINQRIYLFEDIDAEDKIVLRREGGGNIEQMAGRGKKGPGGRMKGNGGAGYDNSLQISPSLGAAPPNHMLSTFYPSFGPPPPVLHLADILNLLDGVLELNGCYVIMTTNHPERLDPALIRPGRVTYRLDLEDINDGDMRLMLQKFHPQYSPTMGHPEIDPLLASMAPGTPKALAPCHFEQLIIHEEDLAAVAQSFRTYLQRPLPPPPEAPRREGGGDGDGDNETVAETEEVGVAASAPGRIINNASRSPPAAPTYSNTHRIFDLITADLQAHDLPTHTEKVGRNRFNDDSDNDDNSDGSYECYSDEEGSDYNRRDQERIRRRIVARRRASD